MFRSVVVALLAALASITSGGSQSGLPSSVPRDRTQLEADLDLAERIIDDPSSPSATLVTAGQFEQLATVTLARQRLAARRAILAALDRPAANAMETNLSADAALARLTTPRKSLPHWRILPPPSAKVLLQYFRSAQSRFRVPWEDLAAIEFVETKFGRVHGLSTAGAQGPMQFLPATWARYGAGDVNNPRDAIFAAARYLVANGAPADMANALYHYNPSTDYVHAITDYAGRMRTDPRAYYGYYWWQVIYARRGGLLILPVGYPKVRPVPVR